MEQNMKTKVSSITTRNGIEISLCKERFLLLNGVLHGRKVGADIYPTKWSEDDVCARITALLNVEKHSDAITEVVKEINSLVERNAQEDIDSILEDNRPQVITNYLRANSYAIIDVQQGGQVLTLDNITELANSGKDKRDVVHKIIAHMFQNIEDTEIRKESSLKDGTLYYPELNIEQIRKDVNIGFNQYFGEYPRIKCTPKILRELRAAADITTCMQVTNATWLRVFKYIAKVGLNPQVLLNTVVSMPDYLETFLQTKTVMSRNVVDTDFVNILIDHEDMRGAVIWYKSFEELEPLLSIDINILSKMFLFSDGSIRLK